MISRFDDKSFYSDKWQRDEGGGGDDWDQQYR